MNRLLILLSLMLGIVCTADAQTLRSANNSYFGKMERDGTVRNASNSYIGKAEGVDAKMAAAIFFMELLLLFSLLSN